ncbi:MAG TPA: hypothetical protein VGM53_35150 [Streptosporangiaceae bacterium]|jgi:hypothetical protein
MDSTGGELLPFEVADEVAAAVGMEELRLLARMAGAGPFGCWACGQEGTASQQTAAAIVVRGRGDELTLLRLAHQSCLRSQVLRDDRVEKATFPSTTDVSVSTALLAGGHGPRAALILDFTGSAAAPGPGGRTDLLISGLLSAGMGLIGDITIPPPTAPGFSAVLRRRKISITHRDGTPLVEEGDVTRIPGWHAAVRRTGQITVLAGSALGLEAGADGVTRAAREGRLAGGQIRVT